MLRCSQSAVALCCIFLIIFLQSSNTVSVEVRDDLQHGPYVDKVVYKVIDDYELRIQALQTGEIDMDIGFIEPPNLSTLSADPDIDVAEFSRNGYWAIIINCNRYPFNISGFRRSFAFAFNKTKVMYEIFGGHASLHDSLVPSVNRWCAEDLFDFHYYDAEPEIGNTILDELGFTINNITGFRDAPNGIPFSVSVLYEWRFGDVHFEIANIAVEALHSLNVSADCEPLDFWYPPVPPENDNFDMMAYSMGVDYDDIDWLVSQYGSGYVALPYHNPSNFRNDTYDSWIRQFRNGKTYEEVSEASTEMQKILHYNVPILVACQNTIMQGYRTDKFEGHVEDLERYISGPWTLRKIQKICNTCGGTINVAISRDPISFNIYTIYSYYSYMIFENLYSSLYSHDPNMNPIPNLVESKLVEIQSNHSSVTIFPLYHMRFTFDIIQNASWSDGEPLTAEDIAFTFNYVNRSVNRISGLVVAYAPTPYRVVIEFSTESYWNFFNIAYEYIIPKHIFEPGAGIGYEGWNTWEPVFNPEEPHVTCGPFILTDFVVGEYYELTKNSKYHWIPGNISSPPPTSNGSPPPPFPSLEFLLIFSTSTVVTIIVGSFVVRKKFDVRLI